MIFSNGATYPRFIQSHTVSLKMDRGREDNVAFRIIGLYLVLLV